MKLSSVRPTHLAPNVEAITPEALRQQGLADVKYILWDFGGTLAQHDARELEGSVVTILKALQAAGIRNVIHSNAYGHRVEDLHQLLRMDSGIDEVLTPVDAAKDGNNPTWYAKPSPAMILAFRRDNPDVQPRQLLIIGDQLTKDMLAANRSGVRSVLLPRRGTGDDWRIRFLQRPIEKILYRLLRLPKIPDHLQQV